MEYENMPSSQNIEDRRGQGGGGMVGAGGLGIVGIIVVFAISYFTGISPQVLMSGAEMIGVGQQSAAPPQTAPVDPNDPTRAFLSRVVGGTEAVWSEVLPAQTGVKYQPATLVIYDGATRSGCGGAQSAMGPFYCPIDKKVYLDTSFFRDMKAKYGGGGDFAYSYVVAHEIGHHVQDLLGILDKVDNYKQQVSQIQANALSVRIELQADCFAGVWANHANEKWKILEPGDIDRAMATAAAIGDDRLQTAARGYAVPDSFTHGSSAMRQKWLTAGLKSGDINSCNTFSN
jgi:predicted metalloprotease